MNIVLLAKTPSAQSALSPQSPLAPEDSKIYKTTESAIKTERTRVTESRLSQNSCLFQITCLSHITPFYSQDRFNNFNFHTAIFTSTDLKSPTTSLSINNCPPKNIGKLEVNDTAVIRSVTQVKHIQQVLGLKVGDSIKVGLLYGKIGTAVISEFQTSKKRTASVLNKTALDSQFSSIDSIENKSVVDIVEDTIKRNDSDTVKSTFVDALDVLNKLEIVDQTPFKPSNSKASISKASNNKSNSKTPPINHQPVKHQIVLSNIKLVTVPPPKLDLTVVLALPRPKVLRRLIMDMTAIGVRNIILVNSYRTDKSYWQSPLLQRLDEFVVEGLQQGVDTVPPSISFKKRFKPFVEDELSLLTQKQLAVVAHPYAGMTLNQFVEQQTLPQLICIGAEGGWIDYEVDMLTNNGCTAISFGNRILRTEAIVNALCGRYI